MKPTITSIAKLTLDLQQGSRACEELRRVIDQIGRGGTRPVEGERQLLAQMEELLGKAGSLFEQLSQALTTTEKKRLVEELEQCLHHGSWDLAPDVVQKLKTVAVAEQSKLREYNASLDQWRTYLNDLQRQIGRARSEGIPLIGEERLLLNIEALVSQIDRALREQSYLTIPQLIEEISNTATKDELKPDRIKTRIDNGRTYAHQADLLLLQMPPSSDGKVFEYTVLLRTPSRPGSHGVNIQGKTTVVRADRDRVVSRYTEITEVLNRTIRRKFAERRSSSSCTDPVAIAHNEPEPSLRDLIGTGPPGALHVDANGLLREVGDFMFRIFMPEQMQDYLRENPSSLTLTTNDLGIPWELMVIADEFLCLNRPLARLPLGRSIPRQVRPTAPRTKKRFLLIYSDPVGTLSAARSEVESIKRSLQETWSSEIEFEVLYRNDATGGRLNEALRLDRYDVIHYAGHADFAGTDPELSSLLLHDQEPFYAQKIRRLLNGRPLVFLNACSSATVATDEKPQVASYELDDKVEGLASAFIYGGALGCLGAIWPVYDSPAAEFAVQFYQKVLEGETIGEAVRQARKFVREAHADQITWASFALYGDPTFRVFT